MKQTVATVGGATGTASMPIEPPMTTFALAVIAAEYAVPGLYELE